MTAFSVVASGLAALVVVYAVAVRLAKRREADHALRRAAIDDEVRRARRGLID